MKIIASTGKIKCLTGGVLKKEGTVVSGGSIVKGSPGFDST